MAPGWKRFTALSAGAAAHGRHHRNHCRAVYNVYLNVPAGDAPEQHPERLAGTITTFGVPEASRSDAQHGGTGLTKVLDITAVRDVLVQQGRWDPARLTVAFAPVVPGPACRGQPEPRAGRPADLRAGRTTVLGTSTWPPPRRRACTPARGGCWHTGPRRGCTWWRRSRARPSSGCGRGAPSPRGAGVGPRRWGTWLLMVLATMLPVVAPQARRVSLRSLWMRRHRAITGFLAGYLALWGVLGVVVAVPVALGPPPVAATVAVLVAGAAWQVAPPRRPGPGPVRLSPARPRARPGGRPGVAAGCARAGGASSRAARRCWRWRSRTACCSWPLCGPAAARGRGPEPGPAGRGAGAGSKTTS